MSTVSNDECEDTGATIVEVDDGLGSSDDNGQSLDSPGQVDDSDDNSKYIDEEIEVVKCDDDDDQLPEFKDCTPDLNL